MPSLRRSLRAHPWRWGVVALSTAGALTLGARAFLPTSVSSVSLQRRDLVRTLALVGRVRASSRVRLGASVTGTVREVRVRPGDRVHAAETVVLLDDAEARALVDEAAASFTEVSASSRAQVERAEQEAALAVRDLERSRDLFQAGALARRELEEAERRAADARSTLEAARAGAGVGPAGVAAVMQARAALEAARSRLAQTRIAAPAAGTVLLRDVEPGDAVQPGRTLLELATDGPVEVVVFPSEDNLEGIALGAPATISADAYPDRTFPAQVSLIASSVDAAQGTVEVRLAVPEPPSYLLPDMTLSVNIEAGRRAQAAVLPEDAVHGLGTGEPWVAVANGGRLERRPVRVGLRAESWVEILDGVREGELVVPVDGSPEPGARVRARAPRADG